MDRPSVNPLPSPCKGCNGLEKGVDRTALCDSACRRFENNPAGSRAREGAAGGASPGGLGAAGPLRGRARGASVTPRARGLTSEPPSKRFRQQPCSRLRRCARLKAAGKKRTPFLKHPPEFRGCRGSAPLGDPFFWRTFLLGNLSVRFPESRKTRLSVFPTLGGLTARPREAALPAPSAQVKRSPNANLKHARRAHEQPLAEVPRRAPTRPAWRARRAARPAPYAPGGRYSAATPPANPTETRRGLALPR